MYRRLSAAALLVSSILFAQSPAPENFFPMAVWYGGGKARAPMLERDPLANAESWRADLRQIRSLGFNTVRCWIDWASGEPSEGRYRFDTITTLLRLAEQEGLRVIVQVYMDSAPAWVGRRFPDSRFVSSNGMIIEPESSPGYCRDHAGVRAAELKFFSALARRASESPALLGWDLWSEPHVINWATPTYIERPEFCFCRHTVARFRTWLRNRYGTLESLNRAWYRQYENWNEVEPNRLSTILSYSDFIDWKQFIADKLGADLHDRFVAVKREAPKAVATSHAAGIGLFSSPLWWEGQSDDWTMTAQVDYYGTSFYPKHSSFVDREPAFRAALLDFTRSFGFNAGGRGFWIGELQSGFGTIAMNVSPSVTPQDLRIWSWSALARGAKAVNYYAWYPMSTGYESGGFGMIELDGTLTMRSREAGSIARVVDQNQRLFLDARPPQAEVAVVYNPLSYFIGGRQRQAAYGGPQGEVNGIERDAMMGIYRALYPSNVPLDFVHIREITAQSLGPYKLVLLPYPLMIPQSAAAALREYVRNGGALVSEARLGWNDERGTASPVIPGLGLSEVMGCRETAVQTGAAGRTSLEWKPGEFTAEPVPGRWFEETLEPLGPQARVAATFPSGAAAAVVSTFGRGKTLMLGTSIGSAYETRRDAAAERFYRALLQWAGVEAPIRVDGATLEVRTLERGRDRLVFVLNHAKQPAEPAVTLRLPGAVYSARTLAGAAELENISGGVRLKGKIGAEDVWVVQLSPR